MNITLLQSARFKRYIVSRGLVFERYVSPGGLVFVFERYVVPGGLVFECYIAQSLNVTLLQEGWSLNVTLLQEGWSLK